MATQPAGKKPAPRKPTTTPKPTDKPKKPVGKAAPAPAVKKPATKPAAKKKATVKKRSAIFNAEKALTPKEQSFVDEYLVDLNATQAAIRAKYSEKSARQIGSENLSKPYIQAAIAKARLEQQKRTQITADKVLEQAWRVAQADAREIVEVKVGCCRYCYGHGHKRQRTISEYNREREEWAAAGKPDEEWDDEGGIGFNPLLLPHDSCPECWGDGSPRVVIKDTRYFSADAIALYAGAKEGKYGIEVAMHDKMAAIDKLFRHLGLYELDNKQIADPLTALLMSIAQRAGNGFTPVKEDPEKPPTRAPLGQVQPDAIDDEDYPPRLPSSGPAQGAQ